MGFFSGCRELVLQFRSLCARCALHCARATREDQESLSRGCRTVRLPAIGLEVTRMRTIIITGNMILIMIRLSTFVGLPSQECKSTRATLYVTAALQQSSIESNPKLKQAIRSASPSISKYLSKAQASFGMSEDVS